jgi:hypothetical protein
MWRPGRAAFTPDPGLHAGVLPARGEAWPPLPRPLWDGPDVFEPLTVNSLIVPGYGGRMYFPANEGFITLQVKPATS